MTDVSECLELRNLYNITQFEIAFNELIISQNGMFKNKKFISSIKDLLDSIEKEKVKAQDEVRNEYRKQRQKGGINSHQAYKPLKAKVEELCKTELSKGKNLSARQLAHIVAKEIENKHKNLLKDFSPYKAQDGTDWRDGSFYNWCNNIYKSFTK